MKLLRFKIQIGDNVSPYRMPYTSESDMEWAKANSVDGEITIEEVPDPEVPSDDSVWDELDAAYQRGVDSV